MPGSRASFVLRRTRFAPLVPASLLLAVLTSVTVTTALASFGARALPAAAHKRLADSPTTTILVSGQIGAARASADLHVIRAQMRSALGTVPFTLVSGRWSDQLTLPVPHSGNQTSQIQAAALDHVMAHAELTAGTWPGPRQPGQPVGVVLPTATAGMLHLSVGQPLVLRDSLTRAPARLRVTGLFRPRDPAAPFWRLSLLGTSGKFVQGSFVTYGPMLVDPTALGSGGSQSARRPGSSPWTPPASPPATWAGWGSGWAPSPPAGKATRASAGFRSARAYRRPCPRWPTAWW